MRKLMITLAALGLSGAALAEDDKDARAHDPVDEVALAVDAQPEAETVLEADDAKVAKLRKQCLRYTGTRIRRPDSCIELPGHVHEKDELALTGERDTAEALRRLDPSVTIRR